MHRVYIKTNQIEGDYFPLLNGALRKPMQNIILQTRRWQQKLISKKRSASQALFMADGGRAKSKIMFIISDAGGGHRSAANAIIHGLNTRFPGYFATEIAEIGNMLGQAGNVMGICLNWAYNKAIQTGSYWLEPILYQVMTKLRDLLFPIGRYYMGKYIKTVQPDLVISLIHGAHDAMFGGMERNGMQDTPVLIVVTDPITIRPSWSHPKAKAVVVATEMARNACIGQGTPGNIIKVLGHPIDPRYATPEETEQELRRRFFLGPDLFTIMLIMGGSGNNNIFHFSRLIAELDLPVQIIACCGVDKKLKARMEQFARVAPLPVKVFGYTQEVHNLMALSDLVITKPGPGTIMEALAKDLPIVIDKTRYTMWQERGNVDFVRDNNLGRIVTRLEDIQAVVSELVKNPAEYNRIKANVQEHKNPHATSRITDLIVETVACHVAKADLT